MFGFPKTDRSVAKSFKTNFLNSVIWQVKFDSNDLVIAKREEVADLLSNLLPRKKLGVSQEFEINGDTGTPVFKASSSMPVGYELTSQDGGKILSLDADTISYVVSGQAYKNYEEFSLEVELLNSVFTLCGLDSFKRAAIRKVNLVEFSYGPNSSSSTAFSSYFIEKALDIDYSYFPDPSLIQQSLQTVNYASKEEYMNLKFGLLVPESGSQRGQYVIDIDIAKESVIPRSELMPLFSSINDEIFNVFNWILSENAKQTLRNG